MPGNLYRRIRAWYEHDQNRGLKCLLLLMIFLFGAGLFTSDFIRSRTPVGSQIERNSYGEGSKEEKYRVKIGEETEADISVEVSERLYSDEEVKSLFSRCTSHMESLILGENKSLDHVEKDLNLITKYPDEPVEISWKSDHYELINSYGEIKTDSLSDEGSIVHLQGTLTYTEDEKEQAVFECSVVLYPKTVSLSESLASAVEEAIMEEDSRTRQEATLSLPEKISSYQLTFYPVFESRGLVLIGMAFVIGLLLMALEKQNKETDRKKRIEQLQLDYPELVVKLSLLFGAGMTLKRAWLRIIDDYERDKNLWGEHFVYEEMKLAKNEMESGIVESAAYEHFGKRCELQQYARLGALLSQNLRKGTKGMVRLLEEEGRQALEERKARAKRLGEEAGTKILLPMFLMLAVVLIMIMVPAFLSVQL